MDNPNELERLRNYKPSIDDLKMRSPEILKPNSAMKTLTKEKIIEKQDELIENLTIQLVTPDPTTVESEGKYMALLLTGDRLHKELAELKELLPLEHPMYSKEFVEWLCWDSNYEAVLNTVDHSIKFQSPNEDRIPTNLKTLDELHTYWEINIKEK